MASPARNVPHGAEILEGRAAGWRHNKSTHKRQLGRCAGQLRWPGTCISIVQPKPRFASPALQAAAAAPTQRPKICSAGFMSSRAPAVVAVSWVCRDARKQLPEQGCECKWALADAGHLRRAAAACGPPSSQDQVNRVARPAAVQPGNEQARSSLPSPSARKRIQVDRLGQLAERPAGPAGPPYEPPVASNARRAAVATAARGMLAAVSTTRM